MAGEPEWVTGAPAHTAVSREHRPTLSRLAVESLQPPTGVVGDLRSGDRTPSLALPVEVWLNKGL